MSVVPWWRMQRLDDKRPGRAVVRFCLTVLVLTTAACSRSEPPARTPVETTTLDNVASPYGPEFWKLWDDGLAEVNAYEVSARQNGFAVLIFRTGRMSASRRVEVDSAGDAYPIMRLDVLREYRPTAHAFTEMWSIFAALEPAHERAAGAISRLTYTMQDWRGNAWVQMIPGGDTIRIDSGSSFPGEGDSQRSVPHPQLGIPEEALPLCARRIAWPRLRLGQVYNVSILSSVAQSRREHKAQTWFRARLSMSGDRRRTTTPAGTFPTHVFECVREGGEKQTWYVEADAPYRIVRWQSTSGESGALLGSARMKPGEFHREDARRRIGLPWRGAVHR